MALVLIAISFWIKGAYIFVKAELGQYLIARAWQQSLENTELSKPWFWADTWPLVRLRVPTQGVSLTVLAGDSGQALAFAPGHTSGSAQPGAKGVVIISGHRDTHFRFLQYLQVGDNIILQNWERQHTVYRVSGMQVVSEDALIEANNNTRSLVLVTCWPFDSFEPNSAQRFIVHAQAIDSY
ncbi:sortase, marine proteobacterial type [Gammaproteobacteria bacterium 53_120_T64]|nr:sortase, marine proteobacterial type [Gammaproteobacteria bacterium 53_120_T64]